MAPRLLVALALGIVLGYERERKGKPAGLRTHAVVCLSTATLMAAAELLQHQGGLTLGDPARMAQGVLTGIGFIGAGTVVRQRDMVTGITTAATIWLAATAGVVVGAGYYVLGVMVTALTVVALGGVDWWIVRTGREAGESELRGEHED